MTTVSRFSGNSTAHQYKIKDSFKVLDYSGDEESLKLWREVLETEVTEFDEQFLYDEYIDVIVYYGNTDAHQYMMQQRVGRTKALSRKQRMDIWKLVEKYVALKQERKVVDRLELFNETTHYLKENNIHPFTGGWKTSRDRLPLPAPGEPGERRQN